MSLECFTGNQKTILSIDFDRGSTCLQNCSYCYVDNMERIYPSYLSKIQRNTKQVKDDPVAFAKRLNEEYTKARKSKSKQFNRLDKMPVRIYGSGDYIPGHYQVLENLNFKFFMISKNLTTPAMRSHIPKLLTIPELTTLRLSFDASNISNYDAVKQYYGKDRIGFCYTGMADDFQQQKDAGYKFDVFFNISHKHSEIDKAKLHKEACPTDVGDLKLQKACTHCNRCWRSSVTSGNWNTFQA